MPIRFKKNAKLQFRSVQPYVPVELDIFPLQTLIYWILLPWHSLIERPSIRTFKVLEVNPSWKIDAKSEFVCMSGL